VTTRKAAAKPNAKPGTEDAEQEGVLEEDELEAVLDIDTLVPKRSLVRIRTPEDREGQLYEMRAPEELGIEEDQLFRSELREFGQLMAKDGLKSAEKKRLVLRLDQLCKKILLAPAEVHEALPPRKKQSIVTRFTSALFVEDAAALPDMTARLVASTMES
jgi:hypothetical protein